MSAGKVLAQVARLQRLREDVRTTWRAYAATADDPDSLIASPEWRAYEKAREAWENISDGSFVDGLLELKRAAVAWALALEEIHTKTFTGPGPHYELEAFQKREHDLAELALVVLEGV